VLAVDVGGKGQDQMAREGNKGSEGEYIYLDLSY